MEKEDVEKIMDLSYKLGRDKYKNDVSLVDMYDLACKVWKEIQDEPKETNVKYYLLNKYQLENLKHIGEIYIDEDEENQIVLMYQDYALRLESGDILDPWELKESDHHVMDTFFDEPDDTS